MKQFWTRIVGDDVEMEEDETCRELLGMEGAMLSPSKSFYIDAHPDDEVYFNANVFTKQGVQLWYGDLNITQSEEKLKEISKRLGEIYVAPELPHRFDGFDKTDRRVIRFKKGDRK